MNNANSCKHDMRPGLYLAQTINARGISKYPCGPGALRSCLKCRKCGHSVLRPKHA